MSKGTGRWGTDSATQTAVIDASTASLFKIGTEDRQTSQRQIQSN
jgi:hypothetical protein